MKRSILIAGALLVFGAVSASAAGINLSWNDCGAAGVQNQTFACNTNSGAPFTAIGSFDPPAGINEFLGISAQIDITTDQLNLPDWWKHGSGQCRSTTGLATDFNFNSGPFTCVDVYSGQAAGGFAYDVGFGTPARARFRIQCAVPIDNRTAVTAGTEYYAFKATFLRGKTVDQGAVLACAGCQNPACIVLNEIQLFQPPTANNDPFIFNAIGRNFITFQSPVGGPPGCPQTTPTKSKTWGQVKSLYR